MNHLTKALRTVTPLSQIVQMGPGDLSILCSAALCLGHSKLLSGLQDFLGNLAQPLCIQRASKWLEEKKVFAKEDKIESDVRDVRTYLTQERKKHRDLLK